MELLTTAAPPSMFFQEPQLQPADGDPPAAVERIDRADRQRVRETSFA